MKGQRAANLGSKMIDSLTRGGKGRPRRYSQLASTTQSLHRAQRLRKTAAVSVVGGFAGGTAYKMHKKRTAKKKR